ncbi:hypothetical protein RSEGYP2_42 [Ralstonia phage RsoP1EGY]|uniref:Endonuclease VII n=1 Tax=Ralstonia phage RsoP1EGY TaxID=2070026 RepID=A0A2R2ZGG3_9CAUD|nr:endonuclease VII [Ralstonia phage RsoP1EGY]AUO78200.1 hypothetical protein RSEGYP2_42 [Ralstonia phage RsoP1EGY]UHX60330.1 endonuclease VII [Ralstonia phage vRsoP-WM2]UHX60383.1 endonuclease VII [Ralstonia phage vRsoP-WR2]
MNWADSKHPVNSVEPHGGNTEPRLRSTRDGVETRHGEPTKTCACCNVEKPAREFYKKDAQTGRLDGICKSCRIIKTREKTLGVTEDDYRRMYHVQGGRCGICQRRLYSKRYKSFAVDHDHETGKVRGLLCHNCNRGLGMFRDDPTALRRAIDWVKV